MKKHQWNWMVFFMVLVLGAVFVIRPLLGALLLPATAVSGTLRARAPRPEDDEIEAAFRKVVEGKILFSVPDEMTVGSSSLVRVGIAKNLTDKEQTGLAKIANSNIDSLNVGTLMRVKVTGDAFTIQNVSDEEQPVRNAGLSLWEWTVTPTKAGKQSLIFSVDILLDAGKKHHLPAYIREIEVRVNAWEGLWKYSKKTCRYVVEHWKEIGSSSGIVMVAWGVVKTWFHYA